MSSPTEPSSRATLSWGGAGIVVATLAPLFWQAISMFPAAGRAWLNYSWQPIAAIASAVILVAAFVVLAVGIDRESGIAGRSLFGKVALIIFPAVSLTIDLLNLAPPGSPLSPMAYLPDSAYDGTGQIDQQALITAFRAFGAIAYLGLAALAIASVFVIRAGVARGAARWALAALALATAIVYVVQLGVFGLGTSIAILRWGELAVPVVQLAVGLLFVLQTRVATDAPPLRVIPQ